MHRTVDAAPLHREPHAREDDRTTGGDLFDLLGHHDLDELLVVDLAVTVNVRLADHLVDLLVSQLLAEVGHDVAELSRRDEAVAVLVEDTEGLLELLLGVGVLHLARHERAELGEVNGAVAVGVDLVDHVLQLGLGRVLAERAHHGAKLLGGDGAVTVLVEQREGLLELGDLLLGQLLVTHDCLLCLRRAGRRRQRGELRVHVWAGGEVA
mmetsp:Transcript_54403/g.161653  ORF Transcript_54403/g.161653 Transcript_54403/m.161653 type:complete len:210 (+) Transcript_54403:166-795(+)